MSLTERQKEYIRATVPVLQSSGAALTDYFYKRMFEHHPHLRAVFNQGNQASGAQSRALAGAVLAYATCIDTPEVLASALDLIAHKHTSVGIRSEHYPIVGMHLLASIQEVLGADTATPELIEAWGAAYGQLAHILIDSECKLYSSAALQEGGWTGWRSFRVSHIVCESDEITSFSLQPLDGGLVVQHQPGQYVSVKVMVDALGYPQIRQYSLSNAPNQNEYRISVKREAASAAAPQGWVSNVLHNQVAVGDVLDLAAPRGNFVLQDADAPLVLMSAGVGITPLLSMLESLHQAQSRRPVWFIHACRSAAQQAFGARVNTIAEDYGAMYVRYFYEEGLAAGGLDGKTAHPIQVGRVNVLALMGESQAAALPLNGHYYLCGPVGFMQEQYRALTAAGVNPSQIQMETFATGGVVL